MNEWDSNSTISGVKRVDPNMATKPLGWPYVAKDQRDRAAEAALAGIRDLEPCLGELPLDMAERIRREARALNRLHQIARLLQEAGAPITG